jgi:hypothetical protein
MKSLRVRHPHREIGICKQLDRLGLGGAGQQDRGVRLQRTAAQQFGEFLGPVRAFADDDPGRVQIVLQGPAFAQELGAEDHLIGSELLRQGLGEADRNGRLDDNRGFRVESDRLRDHLFDGRRVEHAGCRIVIRRCGHDDEIRACKGEGRIRGCR